MASKPTLWIFKEQSQRFYAPWWTWLLVALFICYLRFGSYPTKIVIYKLTCCTNTLYAVWLKPWKYIMLPLPYRYCFLPTIQVVHFSLNENSLYFISKHLSNRDNIKYLFNSFCHRTDDISTFSSNLSSYYHIILRRTFRFE